MRCAGREKIFGHNVVPPCHAVADGFPRKSGPKVAECPPTARPEVPRAYGGEVSHSGHHDDKFGVMLKIVFGLFLFKFFLDVGFKVLALVL
mmetsp:Transcript_13798/g.22441  ORF Transcript_13798/g.22441 Transcript_13798/m.22441 type:complete len:91 (+) Transcript_13798:1335-1607(+)